MSNESILHKLQTECTFPEVFGEKTHEKGLAQYTRLIGHIRADHDGYRWWNTVWPLHQELFSQERAKEMDRLYEKLTHRDALSTLSKLSEFCHSHPEAAVGQSGTEYNFYYEGEHCLFWIRCHTRARDYNLYIYAFAK